MIPVRRRDIAKHRPGRHPSLPQSVKIVLPPKRRVNPWHVVLALIPLAVVGAGGYFAYKKFAAPPVEEEKPEELKEVTLEAPPPEPEPEPEAEPEPEETEAESELPDLLGENDDPAGPATDLSLDLALGTGSGGLAMGPVAKAGAVAAKTAYEPGQAEKDPVLLQGQEPSMPRKAVNEGVSGSFIATFVVNPQGSVESIQVTGSPIGYGFEDAIRKALVRRRYTPAMAGGLPVPMRIRQPFEFRME